MSADTPDHPQTSGTAAALVDAELSTRFTYHAPTPEQAERYAKIRLHALNLARELLTLTPEGREQSLAITHLEEVVFWANAGIARRT